MDLQLLLHKLIQLNLLNILLRQLIILHKLFRILMSNRVPWNIQIGQEPIIKLLIEDHLVMNQLNILCRNEVIYHKVL